MSLRKHVQPLRSIFILADKNSAIAALNELCSKTDDTSPKDGEIVSARYHSFDGVKSIIGLYNRNLENGLDVTIFDNEDSIKDKDIYWEEI